MMEKLSNEIYLLILTYLQEPDLLEWCMCRKKCYDEILRRYIRKFELFLNDMDENRFQNWIDKLNENVIKVPLDQVEICICSYNDEPSGIDPLPYLIKLLRTLRYHVSCCTLSLQNLEEVLSVAQDHTLFMRKLYLSCHSKMVSEDQLRDYLQSISSLQTLSLHMGQNDYQAPYISSVKDLTITTTCLIPVDCRYLSQLEKLELYFCDDTVSDVSMLGHIPDLTLFCCHKITDISALNHNRKIGVGYCDKINDYTRSFEFSEVISLSSHYYRHHVDFRRWKNVKTLNIFGGSTTSLTPSSVIDIPFHTIECSLSGQFVSSSNLSISPLHCLRELRIDNADSITSLENLGLERLVVIELYNLPNLSSLNGVGSGRNQKVVISYCPLITDYSPLRYLHEVNIHASDGTINLDQLVHVHTLTIRVREVVINSNLSYDGIHELFIRKTQLSTFQGLETISLLRISSINLMLIERLLEMGGRLSNHRIDFTVPDTLDVSEIESKIQSCCHRFLQSEFVLLPYARKPEKYCRSYSILTLLKFNMIGKLDLMVVT